ncbi:MAG: hypothetical protein R3C03_06110 [Pirellulaceae bacterium]
MNKLLFTMIAWPHSVLSERWYTKLPTNQNQMLRMLRRNQYLPKTCLAVLQKNHLLQPNQVAVVDVVAKLKWLPLSLRAVQKAHQQLQLNQVAAAVVPKERPKRVATKPEGCCGGCSADKTETVSTEKSEGCCGGCSEEKTETVSTKTAEGCPHCAEAGADCEGTCDSCEGTETVSKEDAGN